MNTPRKKIALVIKFLAGRSGGAERVFCEQANFLVEQGYDVACLVFDPPGPGPEFWLDPRIEYIQLGLLKKDRLTQLLKLAYKLLPKFLMFRDKIRWKARNRDFVLQLNRYFQSAKPDLAVSLLPSANTPTLVAARELDTKVIVTNHNVPKEDYTNPERWGGGEFDRALRLSSLDWADGIHVLFPQFGKWFPSHLQTKIRAIPNYISLETLSIKKENSSRSPVIIGVGRLSSVKNYIVLVEAWALLGEERGEWKVKIFGDGPDQKSLSKRIKELGLEHSFLLMGTTQEIAAEYGQAAIMCHPAKFEGFGLAPAEALANKTPVVAFQDTPGIEEFLVDGKNAILVERRGQPTQNLAEGLLRLMQNENLRVELAEAGPESVLRFNKQDHINQWVDFIELTITGAKHAKG